MAETTKKPAKKPPYHFKNGADETYLRQAAPDGELSEAMIETYKVARAAKDKAEYTNAMTTEDITMVVTVAAMVDTKAIRKRKDQEEAKTADLANQRKWALVPPETEIMFHPDEAGEGEPDREMLTGVYRCMGDRGKLKVWCEEKSYEYLIRRKDAVSDVDELLKEASA